MKGKAKNTEKHFQVSSLISRLNSVQFTEIRNTGVKDYLREVLMSVALDA